MGEEQIKLIPEHMADLLNNDLFSISPDHDSFDNILLVKNLCELHTVPGRYKASQQLRSFIRTYSNYDRRYYLLREIDLTGLHNQYKKWADAKCIDHLATNEYKAFELALSIPNDLQALIIRVNEFAIGFVLFEIVSHEYAIVHFFKADITYRGVYEALHWHTGKMLSDIGVSYLNFEQDLGIENLRRSKQKYRNHSFLKEYGVEKNVTPP